MSVIETTESHSQTAATSSELFDAPSDDGPSSSTTRYTPDSDSDDSDFGLKDENDSQSIQLKRSRINPGGDRYMDEDEGENHGGSQRRASISTIQSYQLYTPDEERAVVKKFDRRLVLFVALLYMLSFLDRSSEYEPGNHEDGTSLRHMKT